MVLLKIIKDNNSVLSCSRVGDDFSTEEKYKYSFIYYGDRFNLFSRLFKH